MTKVKNPRVSKEFNNFPKVFWVITKIEFLDEFIKVSSLPNLNDVSRLPVLI